ncbi:P-type ATPase, cytoplasmic domain N [Pseudocohnilembus persalinus]|uniref:Phospholipid-transporting ATPase n=1 Tax=Pseudocohnilembus persalinus TaxID=266149 RepID=A0A0V0QH99_PSEPJ|nr:P-type ATPase, cytoplasmic domain N [Pseudocohnilembus persalinus]|eukprot:KRX01550.1 P-type ATPase, cytoplasmic domain N [Pseudocohnilembus persalinus]
MKLFRKQSTIITNEFGYDYKYENNHLAKPKKPKKSGENEDKNDQNGQNNDNKNNNQDIKNNNNNENNINLKNNNDDKKNKDMEASTNKSQVHEKQSQRRITSGRIDRSLCNNGISTSKYTWYNFLPKNLMEQFSKLANVYFLIFGYIQTIDSITISDGVPTIYLPLVVIVILTALKDFYEDYKRKKADKEENQSKTHRYDMEKKEFVQVQWRQLMVGDIVRVENKEFFPADLLVLNSSELKGECYIETKGLDGETNLKQRICQKEIYKYFLNNKDQENFSEQIFSEKRIIVKYEQPNPLLEVFSAGVYFSDNSYQPLSNSNITLRGCSLQNSHKMYGLVLNTGHDTKIQKNSFKARAKRSRMDNQMNWQILQIFVIMLAICAFCAIYYIIYYGANKDEQGYLDYDDDSNTTTFFIKFGNWVLIFGNFIPISLLVTLEFVKLFQALLIENDYGQLDDPLIKKKNHSGMVYYYYDEAGKKQEVKTAVQSSNLNEELGQIEYIFSDKTGTLTCNIMKYKKISINGVSYGDVQPGDQNYLTEEEVKKRTRVTNVDFRDRRLLKIIDNKGEKEHEKVVETLQFLALCHTILVSREQNPDFPNDDTKKIARFNASSPDELALVNFAKFCGVEFVDKDQDDNYVINCLGEQQVHKILYTFEFDSDRKRQSVVTKNTKTGKITLLCKGADSVILKLSNKSQNSEIIPILEEHLNAYSVDGLRTLLLARREIPSQLFEDWVNRYKKAEEDLVNGPDRKRELQAELEVDLNPVAATAIEDQLQDEVGETIAALKEAGIKLWVLTGDKVETAINIGYSCKLLTEDMNQFEVQLSTEDAKNLKQGKIVVKQKLEEINEKLKSQEHLRNQKNALIITGDALIHGLEKEIAQTIIEITNHCDSVLCCRVSPKQKQEIVSLVKKNKPTSTTLAIGDGANDVNMITAAHVGVGIKGLEGYQASRASDYAIGEFKLLRRLLFVHGREAYRRNANLVCYNFYKNIVLVVPQFWYGWVNFFAGQTLYDSYIYQVYNVFYTSMPIMLYAVLDLEYSPSQLWQNKLNYYLPGLKHQTYNNFVFWKWFFLGIIQAGFVFLVCFYSINNNFVDDQGRTLSFWAGGQMVFGIVVVIVNLKILIISFDHTFLTLFFNFGSQFLFLVTLIVCNYLESSELYYQIKQTLGSWNYHWGNILLVGICSFIIDFTMERYERGMRGQQLRQNMIKFTKSKVQPENKQQDQKQMEAGILNSNEQFINNNSSQQKLQDQDYSPDKEDCNKKQYQLPFNEQIIQDLQQVDEFNYQEIQNKGTIEEKYRRESNRKKRSSGHNYNQIHIDQKSQ